MPRTLTSSMHTGMFDEMSRAVDRLALNDASVTVRHELCRNQAVRRVDGVEATIQQWRRHVATI